MTTKELWEISSSQAEKKGLLKIWSVMQCWQILKKIYTI